MVLLMVTLVVLAHFHQPLHYQKILCFMIKLSGEHMYVYLVHVHIVIMVRICLSVRVCMFVCVCVCVCECVCCV